MTTLSVEPFDASVPAVVQHTSSSAGATRFDANAFLQKQGHSQDMIQEAREEHAERQQSVCISGESLRKDFGAAMVVFFQWQKCAGGVCAVLLILSIINYAVFASKEDVDFSLRVAGSNTTMQIASWYSHFFISQYTERQRAVWLSTCIVALVVVFLACPVFAWAIRRINGRIDDPGTEALIVRFADNGTIDVSPAYASTSTLAVRRLISVTVFGIFIAVQVIVSYFLTKADSGSLGISFAISFLAAVLNIAYGMFARYLTEVEKHGRISTYNTSVAIKLILFKLANVMSVYGAKTYSATVGQCVYDIIGEQFMTLILVDIVFTTPITVVLAYVQTNFHQQIATVLGSINSDNANKAQFDLSAEYLNNLYRFYIAVMALVVFPLSTVMSIVSFFVAFWAAKFRLVKICGDPGRSQNSQRWIVAGFMALMCVAALLTPYAGAAFILSGWTAEHTTSLECPFPN